MSLKNHKQYVAKLKKIDYSRFYQKIDVMKNDVLMVIDMQNDFIDRKYPDHKTGKLPTHNAKRIVNPIMRLINKCNKPNLGAKVIATRDYHPKGKTKADQHCSFPVFGEHCVKGTKGSDLAKEIEKEMTTGSQKNRKLKKNNHVVFKAFHKQIDSFGAFKYQKKDALKRVCGCTKSKCPVELTGGKGPVRWSRYPKILNNLKPTSYFMKPFNKKQNFIFICGVLGDFCVLDTAINARRKGYKNVVIVVDLIRNLRIKKGWNINYPTSPKKYSQLSKKHGFYFVLSKDLNFKVKK